MGTSGKKFITSSGAGSGGAVLPTSSGKYSGVLAGLSEGSQHWQGGPKAFPRHWTCPNFSVVEPGFGFKH